MPARLARNPYVSISDALCPFSTLPSTARRFGGRRCHPTPWGFGMAVAVTRTSQKLTANEAMCTKRLEEHLAREMPMTGSIDSCQRTHRSVTPDEWMEHYLARAPLLSDEALSHVLELYELERS
jgi:hypothetical protein